jgi:predicted glycogen debranching enzyme
MDFGPQVCGDLAAGAAREWLVTDGVGGYAMGTVSGLRTRRYHGLLMVAEPGAPARRRLALAALDPELRLPSGAVVRLAVHEWSGGVISPEGHLALERFDLADGLPRWRWRIGDIVLTREVAMAYGTAHTAVVHTLVAAPGPVTLTLKALTTWRDGHGERGAGGPPPTVEPTAGGVEVEGAYRLAGPGWRPAGEWYRGAYARQEAARGLNATEDLWYAGDFTAVLAPGETLEVSAWAGDLAPPPAREVVAVARARNRALVAGAADDVDAALVRAADAFVVRGPDVVAGYPWFGTWSRDTMTAYEGLLLATGRVDEGRQLLLAYAATLSEGMLANTADTGQTEYNTVDATLWFLHAAERHVARTGDADLAVDLVRAAEAILGAHLAGTRYNIRVDPADGLLGQGAPGVALTWMDARVDGVPVTARRGKPVEVNALWVNALGAVAALRARTGHDTGDVERLRDRAAASFRARFRSPNGWLYDAVDPLDATLRPNQVLAYSLPHAPFAAVARPTATSPITRAPCGRGCSARTATPPPTPPRSRVSRPIFGSGGSARSARRPTAIARTARPAARSRPGQSPRSSGPAENWHERYSPEMRFASTVNGSGQDR